jgi:hypothetical protein
MKKKKRETPQKEWQAKCTRTWARAHIVKKKFPGQNKTKPNSKESSALFGKYDGWQFIFDSLKTEWKPSQSRTTHYCIKQNLIKLVTSVSLPSPSCQSLASSADTIQHRTSFTLLGILYNCTPGLTITFTVMTEFLRKLQQFTPGRCTRFAALLVAAIPCSFRTHSKTKKLLWFCGSVFLSSFMGGRGGGGEVNNDIISSRFPYEEKMNSLMDG